MPIDDILLQVEEEMESAVNYLREEFGGIRTGRASSGLVDHMKVDYYGSPTDLRQLASIATPEANLIVIKPFDPGGIKDIEKAINASDLGINPMVDGKIIRLQVHFFHILGLGIEGTYRLHLHQLGDLSFDQIGLLWQGRGSGLCIILKAIVFRWIEGGGKIDPGVSTALDNLQGLGLRGRIPI